jgi:hypothetical protein
MHTRSKLMLTALIAALAIATSVSGASARSFSISEQRFRAVWTPLSFTGIGGLIIIRCNLTLSGSFHTRTSSKTRGSLAGYITSAALTRPCSGGEAWILNGVETLPTGRATTNSLPWHIIYDSFRGTLPRIEGIRTAIVGSSWLIIAGSNQCLYRSTAESPTFGIINLNTATGAATSVTAGNESQIPLGTTLAGACPSTGHMAGTTTSYSDGEGGTLTVRLI